MSQLSISIPFNDEKGQDTLYVSEANQDAIAYLKLWPNWTNNTTLIIGEEGSGKSHLASIWQISSKATVIDQLDDNTIETLISTPLTSPIIIDLHDIEDHNKGQADALFHLYNHVKNQQGHLLILCRHHPKSWPHISLDLRSRMMAATILTIKSPNDDTIAAILVKQLSDRQIQVSPDVIHYLIPRIERRYSYIKQLVQQIDTITLEQKRKLTIPLIRDILNVKE